MFKIGDKVRVKKDHSFYKSCSSAKTEYLIITLIEGGTFYWDSYEKNGEKFDSCYGHNLSNKDLEYYKTMGSLKEKFIKIFTKEPYKTFREKGITNGDDLLTADGIEMYINWLFKRDADAFKTEVADNLQEEK